MLLFVPATQAYYRGHLTRNPSEVLRQQSQLHRKKEERRLRLLNLPESPAAADLGPPVARKGIVEVTSANKRHRISPLSRDAAAVKIQV